MHFEVRSSSRTDLSQIPVANGGGCSGAGACPYGNAAWCEQDAQARRSEWGRAALDGLPIVGGGYGGCGRPALVVAVTGAALFKGAGAHPGTMDSRPVDRGDSILTTDLPTRTLPLQGFLSRASAGHRLRVRRVAFHGTHLGNGEASSTALPSSNSATFRNGWARSLLS